MRQERIDQGQIRIAGGWVDDHTGGLVDHDHLLILAGLATIAVTIFHRMNAGKAGERPIERPLAEWPAGERRLSLPAGSRVAGMAMGEGRLLLRLEGPGTEQRLLVIELASGRS